ncbi:hypothetical protein [Streptomyces sp. NPDC053427]|uniref:hypothetical protein n=1 Tax=Streptomyces sp. NPDC053427 TaxID=3365701 RepID=UPI0037D556BB
MRRLIAVPTVLLALTAAGCGSGDESRERPNGGAGSGGSHGEGRSPEAEPPSSGPSAGVPGQPVRCGEIPDALGDSRSVALFADPGADGTVGCGEAHDVMAEFFLRAPQLDGEKPGSLTVRGWFCRYESGPTGTWISICGKDRLEMHTEEASGEDSGPDASAGPEDPGESQQPGGPEDPGESEEPGIPDDSQLPGLPDQPSDPMDEPSTEEL